MSIATEIERLKSAKANIKTAIEAKGVTVGDGTLDTYSAKIDEIPSGVDISEYFDDTLLTTSNTHGCGEWVTLIKKIPKIKFKGDYAYGLFYNYPGTSIDLSEVDVSNTTSITEMFSHCYNVTSLDLSNFNTSNVEYMSNLFTDCNSLTSIDISNWDVSNVQYCSSLFVNCNSLTTLKIPENLITSRCTSLTSMFQGCSSLENIDVSKFDTSSCTDMSFIFSDCSKIASIDISNFKTQQVQTFWCMFYRCSALKTITGLDKIDTSNAYTFRQMFRECTALENLDLHTFNTNNIGTGWLEGYEETFYLCNNLKTLNISSFSIPSTVTTSAVRMFFGCYNLENLNMSSFDFTKVSDYDDMFANVPNNCYILVKDADSKEWITSKWSNLANVHYVGEEG